MNVYFGDNQFLGVNHLSVVRSSEYLEKFKSPESISEVLREAYSAGVRDFMFTVHPKTLKALELIYDDCPFNLHLSLPYAHSVNELITELGMFGTIKSFLKNVGLSYATKAAFNALRGSYKDIITIILRHEVSPYSKFNISSINLLNVATDFLIGSGRGDILKDFYFSVSEDFKVKPGFFTMNYPMVANFIWNKQSFDSAQIIFNVNPGGFRMNPSKDEVFEALDKYKDRTNIAMSIFSSKSSFDEVMSFLGDNRSIKGALFGSSNPKNIMKSNAAITKL